MVYNAQNYWVTGLCPSSGILNTREHKVPETGAVLRTERDTVSGTFSSILFTILDQ
jgi:hypothetical protein